MARVARKVVADASALIAYLDAADAHHEAAIAGLSAVDAVVVHAITLAEVLVHPTRTGVETDVLATLDAIGCEESDMQLEAVALARLRVETGLRMPDCIVLAAALHHRLDVLTFDDRLDAAVRRATGIRDRRSRPDRVA